MKSAIEDYRVDKDDPDYQKDTNNAVENVQDVVSKSYLVTHSSLQTKSETGIITIIISTISN